MLLDMKAVKMLGLGEKLFNCVSHLRGVGLQVSEKFRILLIGQVILYEYILQTLTIVEY